MSMTLPPYDYTWLALRCAWMPAEIKGVGRVDMARAMVRAGRFARLPGRDVIVAIRRDDMLLTYDVTDAAGIVAGRHKPFLTLYPGGVDIVSCYEYYDWPWGEAVWSGFTGKDLADAYEPFKYHDAIARSWLRAALPGWWLIDQGLLGPSVITECRTLAGDAAIVEVSARGISIHLCDGRNMDIDAAIHIFTVPAHAPDHETLHRMLGHRETHQARALLRWYRRILFDAVIASEML